MATTSVDDGNPEPQLAPTFNTGGGGFTFEDYVGAWFLAALIAGKMPLGATLGVPTTVRFQVSAGGWKLDDILVVGDAAGSPQWSASVKSFDMLTGAKLPAEFVKQAWADLLREDAQIGHDFVGLVCGSAAQGNWSGLERLIGDAASDPDGIADRIQTARVFNDTERSLWDSCECPVDVAARHGLSPAPSPARLLRSLLPLRLEFMSPTSQATAAALEWCRDGLAPERAQDNADLWNALLTLVAEFRPRGGVIDWPMLAHRLGPRFAFRLRPDVAPDWLLLDNHTSAGIAAIRDALGDGITLERSDVHSRLEADASASPTTLLFGDSGCGKTALAKRWVAGSDAMPLWLTAADLDGGIPGFGARLHLQHGLLDVLGLAPGDVRIVVDGVDRSFNPEHFVAAAAISRYAASSGGRIAVVITSQQTELPRVARELVQANASATTRTAVPNFEREDLRLVLEQAPELARVVIGGQLQGVFTRPKLLDVLLRAASTNDQILGTATDEAAVARIWWQEFIATGSDNAARQELLIALATEQADRLVASTPVGDLSPAVVSPVERLRADGVLSPAIDRYAFGHDLFTDWTLLHRLVALGARGLELLSSKGSLPSWHRAARLYALTLLNDDGVEAWDAARRQLDAEDHRLVAELFLDAPLFADDPLGVLESLWPSLSSGETPLLARLLRRFLYVATLPDPRGALIFDDSPELEAVWAANTRVPVWPLWLPMLEFLARHVDDAIAIDRHEVVAIANLWLRWTAPAWPGSQSAAALALASGKWLQDSISDGVYVSGTDQQAIWRVVIAAGSVASEAVDRSRETLRSGRSGEIEDQGRMPAVTEHALRDAILDGDGLTPIIQHDPATAADLAALAAIDTAAHPGFTVQDTALQITDASRWFSSLPERGPFLQILRQDASEGLRCVLAIVEHATDRWIENRRSDLDDGQPQDDLVSVVIDGREVALHGDSDVMHWYRGAPRVPKVLASALMALEQYLYQQIDAGADIAPILDEMTQSRSAAVWGLLVAIVKYRPDLLRGPLPPIITSAGLLVCDRAYSIQDHGYLLMGGLDEATLRERLIGWHTMPHRTSTVIDFVMRDVLTGAALVDDLAVARERWAEADREGWKHLIAQMDPANHRLSEQEDGTVLDEYLPPEELQADIGESQRNLAETHFWITLPYRLRTWIESGHRPDDAELQTFWERAQERLTEPASASVFDGGMRSRADLECGIAALYLTCARDWLSDQALRWCRQVLLAPFENPPPAPMFDVPDAIVTETWDAFCAEAIPILWSETPEDPELRSAVARLAVHAHYHTVAQTFRNVARHEALTADLRRLEHLSLYWARFISWRHHIQHRREQEEFGIAPEALDEVPDLTAATREAVDAFSLGTLSVDVPRLTDWITETPSGLAGARADPHSQVIMSISLGYLVRAHMHMVGELAHATADARAHIFRFAQDLATVLMTGLDSEDSNHRHGTLYEDEREALKLLALLTLAGTADEVRPIWEPILAAGGHAEDWVDEYLDELWAETRKHDPWPSEFPAVVKEMLAYASSAESWRIRGSAELQLMILGINRWGATFPATHASLIQALQPEWAGWIQPRMHSSWFARRIVKFLESPGAKPVLEDAIAWLADRERNGAPHDSDLDDDLAELLMRLDIGDPTLLRSANDTAVNARFLLERIAGRGVALALELCSRLG